MLGEKEEKNGKRMKIIKIIVKVGEKGKMLKNGEKKS